MSWNLAKYLPFCDEVSLFQPQIHKMTTELQPIITSKDITGNHECYLLIGLNNSLPHNKILDVAKLKALAGGKINVAQKMISISDRVENIVGKRKCWLSALSLFPILFLKAFFLRVAKSRNCVVHD